MSELSAKAEPSVVALLEADEDHLYEQLGIRAQALARSPQVAGDFDPDVYYDGVAMGPLDAVRDFGRRIFRRWEVEGYRLVCGGDADDSQDRTELLNSVGVGETAAAAALAGLLVAQLGVAPAIAAVVAALVIKRFFRPTYEEFCDVWKERLPAAP